MEKGIDKKGKKDIREKNQKQKKIIRNEVKNRKRK